MKILYLYCNPGFDHSETHSSHVIHIMSTVESLRKLGHSVDTFFPGANDYQTSLRGRFHSLKKMIPEYFALLLRDIYELHHDMTCAYELGRILETYRPDFIYERTTCNHQAGVHIARKYRIPIIVELNAPLEEKMVLWGAPLLSLSRRIEQRVLTRASAIITVSSSLKEYYVKKGVNANKIFVMPNGVDGRLFNVSFTNAPLRKELGLDKKVIIGLIGNFRVYHGTELFYPLCNRLVMCSHRFHFLIVGHGHGIDDLLMKLSSSDLQQYFTFIKPVPHKLMRNYISVMDICLMPNSNWYGSPMKIFEYAAMGKAIVAPKLPPLEDVLVNGKTAFLFNPGDPNELFLKVKTLVENKALRGQLGSRARKELLGKHAWIHNAERIISIHCGIKARRYVESSE